MSALLRLSVWALIAFHALIFARRLGDATITDPVIALRWMGSAFLLTVGWIHVRRGGSLVRGRGALAFWLAAFLLHALALAPGAAPVVDTTAPILGLSLAATAILLVAVRLTVPARSWSAIVEGWTSPPSNLDRIARMWGRPPPLSLSA